MTEAEIDLVPPRNMGGGKPSRVRVRTGDTGHRTRYACWPSGLDLVPVALIDWDTAASGPRAWDLGWVAWRWVPFCRDEKSRAIGLPSGVADKARRFRLLLDAYGIERDLSIVHAGMERARQMLEHQL